MCGDVWRPLLLGRGQGNGTHGPVFKYNTEPEQYLTLELRAIQEYLMSKSRGDHREVSRHQMILSPFLTTW